MGKILRGEEAENLVDLLSDESRVTGTAEGLSQPESEEELKAILAECSETSAKVTVSAGLTGISAGGVPQGGIGINLARMNLITGIRCEGESWFVTCQPGVSLDELRTALEKKEFESLDSWTEESRAALEKFRAAPPHVFTPDPTETSADIGGMVACNASGARSFSYGPTRKYVEAIRGMLVDGRTFTLKRGEVHIESDRTFTLHLDNGENLTGKAPDYNWAQVKNAAGYYVSEGMDLVDLFIGSEGTLAIFTELELRLVPAPEQILGIIAFLPGEDEALSFVRGLRGESEVEMTARPLAIEFFDYRTLNLLREASQEEGPAAELPDLPPEYHTAIYLEFAGDGDTVDEATMSMVELLESCGGNEEATWIASEPHEHERLKHFRHLVPETVNSRIGHYKRDCPTITKLGTDMAVPDEHLEKIITIYRSTLDPTGLEYVIFGHIGDNHVHVNILPKNEEEYSRGKEIYKSFAQEAVALGGTISGEHGIGKLKAFLLPTMYGAEGIAAMRTTKEAFDPEGRLNRDVLFNWDK